MVAAPADTPANRSSKTRPNEARNSRPATISAGLAGIYSGPMVMTTWYPARYTAWGYGVRQGNLALGITTGIDLIREFSPEIKNLFLRRRPGQNSIR
jgi:hypothetical protein